MAIWNKFPNYRQLDRMDCGPTCVQIVAKHFDIEVPRDVIRNRCALQKGGTSFAGIIHALDSLGIDALAVKADFWELEEELPLPLIAHWDHNHFVVVHKVSRKRIHVSDPALGRVFYTFEDFKAHWCPEGTGMALLVEAGTSKVFPEHGQAKRGGPYLLAYLLRFKNYLGQLGMGLFLAMAIQLLLPFLTQALVDIGIANQETSFIHLILLAYGLLVLIKLTSQLLRDRLLLHLSSRVRVKMVADYLERVLMMPIIFFDQKTTGDFVQRVHDHEHIEDFVGGNALSIIFDGFGLVAFGTVLAFFDGNVFGIFLLGTSVFLGWSLLFMPAKERLDHQRFEKQRKEQSLILQMVLAVQDIKLNGSQQRRIREWKANIHRLFGLERQVLRIDQAQLKGGLLIQETTFLVILLVSAKAVVAGNLTLGTLLAIHFILGSLALPLSNIIHYLVGWQRAKLSLERLMEIHGQDGETQYKNPFPLGKTPMITLQDVHFGYGGSTTPRILKDISFTIPFGKTLAIVGPSGSGKSTLLKLLLKLYEPRSGQLLVGSRPMRLLDAEAWRRSCGAVLQDSRVFSDTLERNITESTSLRQVNMEWLQEVLERTRLAEVVHGLPLGLDTHIGENGQLLSGGERQRLLLARALYKRPKFLFLDEPTSALDGENEHGMLESLFDRKADQTLVIVAHRLSTIKNADHILVLEQGRIVQQGTHLELIAKEGSYQRLMAYQT